MSGRFDLKDFDLASLPTMPSVAEQMIRLINSPESSADELAKVVEKDPAVSARVLRIANSSFYSMSRQVSTLSKAIVVLGEKTLKSLVLAASLRGIHEHFGRLEQMLWEESMVTALASRFLAHRLANADPEEAFLAGLFCHIGKVLLNNRPDVDEKLMTALVCDESVETVNRERELFGFGHPEISAAILEKWKLAEALCLVAFHHFDADIANVEEPAQQNLIGLVNLACALPGHFGIYGAAREIDLDSLPGAAQLQIDGSRWTELLDDFGIFFAENRETLLG